MNNDSNGLGFFESMFSKKNLKVSVPTINSFFAIREIKDDLVVLANSSVHVVLDVEPITPTKEHVKKMAEMIGKFRDFLEQLDFNIKICIRTVNDKLDIRLKMLRETTISKLKKEEKFSQAAEFRDFMDWFEDFTSENCFRRKKRYIVVSTHTDDKKMTYEQLKIRLNSKVNFLIDGLDKAGIKDVVRLDNTQLKNLFESYIKFYIYYNDDYATSSDILQLYKLKKLSDKDKAKRELSKNVKKVVDEIKDYIKLNKAIYKNDIQKYSAKLSEDEKGQVERSLNSDENIGLDDDIYKFIPTEMSKKQQGTLSDSLALFDAVEEQSNYIRICNDYMRCFTTTAYPEEVSKEGFLENIFDDENFIDIVLDVNVIGKHNVMSYYTRKSQELEIELSELHDKGYQSEELDNKMKQTLARIADIKKLKIFTLSTYFLTSAPNIDLLNVVDNKLHTLTRANKLFIKPVINHQMFIYKTMAPLDAIFLSRAVREIVTTANLLAYTYPFKGDKK